MKIELKLWTVFEGELKEILFSDEIYTVKRKTQEIIQKKVEELVAEKTQKAEPLYTDTDSILFSKKEVEPKPKPKSLPEGKEIAKYDTISLHLNVYNDVKKWMDEGLSRRRIGKHIHERYKLQNRRDSCNALASCYMRYIRGLKPKQKKGLDRGEKIGSKLGNSIYKNPHDKVLEAIAKKQPWSYLRDHVLKPYYPKDAFFYQI